VTFGYRDDGYTLVVFINRPYSARELSDVRGTN